MPRRELPHWRPDPVTGEPAELLWVKGSGGDLGSLTEKGQAHAHGPPHTDMTPRAAHGAHPHDRLRTAYKHTTRREPPTAYKRTTRTDGKPAAYAKGRAPAGAGGVRKKGAHRPEPAAYTQRTRTGRSQRRTRKGPAPTGNRRRTRKRRAPTGNRRRTRKRPAPAGSRRRAALRGWWCGLGGAARGSVAPLVLLARAAVARRVAGRAVGLGGRAGSRAGAAAG